jgi:methylornithine synthase
MISPGVVPDQVLGDLANAGATWYACYQETHSQKLFRKLRPDQDYTERLKRKFLAHDLGLLIEEGILLGIGERPSDLAKSIATMRLLEADQVRAMRFIPQTGTPMEHTSAAGPELEQRFIALLRLVFPDRLIPATLDVDGLAGLKQRLDAGANVITSLVPPKFGLAGVAQKCLDIENAHRTTHHVAKILADCGLHAATTDEYRQWIENQRIHRTHSSPKKAMPCALQ